MVTRDYEFEFVLSEFDQSSEEPVSISFNVRVNPIDPTM